MQHIRRTATRASQEQADLRFLVRGWERQKNVRDLQHEVVDGARCRDHAALMYPEDEDSDGIDAAKEVCADCPVRTRCLLLALRLHEDEYGVWGGRSPEERQALRRRLALLVPGMVERQARAS